MSETAPTRPARTGRTRILDAATDLMAQSTLDEVGAFMGARAVARAGGVSPGTITHHFPAGSESLGRAAIRRAFERVGWAMTDQLALGMSRAVSKLYTDAEAGLTEVANALIAEVAAYSPDSTDDFNGIVEAEETACLLTAAVAPRDPEAAKVMREFFAPHRRQTEEVCEAAARALGRVWVSDATSRTMALAVNSLANGFIFFRRFDIHSAPLEEYAKCVLLLFDAISNPRTDDAQGYRESLVPGTRKFAVDPNKRLLIAQAALLVYQSGGWSELSVAEVARKAGVSRPTVVANFRDRNGLAAAVWSERHLRNLEASMGKLELLRSQPTSALKSALLSFVLAARDDFELTHAFLAGVFAYTVEHGVARDIDPADPRNLVPLPGLLVPIVESAAASFKAGNADTKEQIRDTAALLTNSVLHLALTRPSLPPEEIAAKICETMLAGMLRSD